MRESSLYRINDIHGFGCANNGEGDLVAATSEGVILHYTNGAWNELQPSALNAELKAVWSGTDAVFAVGRWGTILRYDKKTQAMVQMQPNSQETLTGIWGATDNDMFAVGSDSAILHYEGNEWTRMAKPTSWMLYDVWGNIGQPDGDAPTTDVFAVGEKMTILQYKDHAWSSIAAPPSSNVLQTVWGSSSKDVFAASNTGELFHFDGVQWSQMRSPTDTSTNIDLAES